MSADFFEEVDALGIVETHIQRVLKLEDKQAASLLRRYKEIRSELRDRIERFPGDSFSAHQLRGVLVQVDGAIDAMGTSLKDGMADSSKVMAERGVRDQIEEIKAFEKHFRDAVVPINLDAQLVAEDTSNFLINRYEASIDAYSEDLRSQLVSALTNESLMQTPYSTVIKKMGLFFQGEEWKLHRIARTELHNMYGQAKLNGMGEVKDAVLPDLKKTLIHPMDGRTADDSKFVKRLDLIVDLDKPFRYRWKGKERVYMSPPDRPNDRSILVPYRQSWDSTS
jgi:hypothetical protein